MMNLLWLTNMPSIYRVDFFNELGKQCRLTVLFERYHATGVENRWDDSLAVNFEALFTKNIRIGRESAFGVQYLFFDYKHYDNIVVSSYSSPSEIIAIEYMKAHHIPYWIEGDGAFAKSGKGIKELVKKHLLSGAVGYFSTGRAHDEYYLTYGSKPDKIFRYPFTSIREADVLASPTAKEDKNSLKVALGMGDKPVVLTIGQMIPRKGVDILIRAAAQYKDADFYLVGGKPPEEYINLKETLHADNIFFVEFKKPDELKQYYQAADMFLLPTREDIWGLVINEAMANGLPVVTTDRCVAGLELVRNGENGFIVPVEDVSATVEAIRSVMAADIQAMGERSLEIIRNYTIEEMAKRHLEIIQNNE